MARETQTLKTTRFVLRSEARYSDVPSISIDKCLLRIVSYATEIPQTDPNVIVFTSGGESVRLGGEVLFVRGTRLSIRNVLEVA